MLRSTNQVILSLMLAWVPLFVVGSGCRRQAEVEQDALLIGFMTTLSGEFAQQGEDALNGARLAVAQRNRSGGLVVGGRRYRVVLGTADTPATPEGALAVALRLINQDHVVALVGPFLSSTAVPVANLAENAKMPMISPTATNPEVTAGKEYVFRTTFVDDFQGRAMARFARAGLGARTTAVLYDVANDYNRDIAVAFQAGFQAMSGQVVASESYVTGERDFGTQLGRIQNSGPDVLFLPNFPEDVRIQLKQARQLKIATTFLGSDVWEERSFASLPEFDQTFYSHHWHPDAIGTPAETFVQSYRQVYGAAPNNRSALTYDAFGLLFQAIEQQNSLEGVRIRAGLAATTGYVGVTGTISFQGGGDPLKSVFVLHIKDGRAILYEKIDPE